MSTLTRDPDRIPVLIFLSNFLIGGTERQVVNLVRGLDRGRFDVHLACFRREGPLLEELDLATVAVTEYGISTLLSPRTLWQQVRLARYLRAHRVQIVHSFGFHANVFAIPAARLGGAEVVVASIRDTGDHLTRPQAIVHRWACRAADHVLVNALAVGNVLGQQGYDASRISVIRNGIDVARFRERGQSSALRRELGFPASAPIVAVFSRLNALKGIEHFIEAAASLAGRFPDVRFLIVGDSLSQVYRRGLEQQAVGLGLGERLIFTGFRRDVPELLSEVAVSVLPSLSEGLSNVVLEAMAAGVPIVSTAVGGAVEMVEDGVSGLLVPPRDAGALVRAITSLLEDPERAAAMGEAGRQRIADYFSLEGMVRRTEGFYERQLRRRRQPRAGSRPRPSVTGTAASASLGPNHEGDESWP